MPTRSRGRVSQPQPVAGAKAFTNFEDRDYLLSQAATLLLIGTQIRRDTPIRLRAPETRLKAAPTNLVAAPDPVPSSDMDALGFPDMAPQSARFSSEELQGMLGKRFAAPRSARPTESAKRNAAATLPRIANAFYKEATPATAGALLEASLEHAHELVRVSAASSYFDLTVTPHRALAVLEKGVSSADPLTRQVAAHALARLDPANPALNPLLRRGRRPTRLNKSHTSTIIHGTWARGSGWWQPPSGDFWKYLKASVDPSLYGAANRFEWSGGYSDAARSLGGSDLHDWVAAQGLAGLDLYTHSHGGSVAMLANHAGTAIGKLVMLSCPVHWPKYTPDFASVKKVVSVRVHLDLVILADRGGQKFKDAKISENVLPLWFDHFATHDPANWVKYNIPAKL
ncbi:MAG TPA: hypothetical protein VFA68_10665 [Terriglobales bacterium]|nr:hypothetical protein [Terriglobales bacterium]